MGRKEKEKNVMGGRYTEVKMTGESRKKDGGAGTDGCKASQSLQKSLYNTVTGL